MSVRILQYRHTWSGKIAQIFLSSHLNEEHCARGFGFDSAPTSLFPYNEFQ